jgi:cytochrome P450
VVRGIKTVVTRDPAHIHRVLVTDGESYQKPETGIGATQLRTFLGNGLVSSNGDFWRGQRRQIQPAFDGRHLETYSDTMVTFAAEAASEWRDGEVFDMSEAMMALTLRVVGKVLFGQDTRAGTGDVAEAMQAFRSSFDGLSLILPSWVPYPPRNRGLAARARMHAMMDGWVGECRAGRSPDPTCLLNVLVRSLEGGGSMSDAQLRDEALTLFFAGHETTSHALSWTWYLLSQHPAVWQKLADEVSRVVGERSVRFADFSALSYTRQVLDESMRLYPPVFAVAREARVDAVLGDFAVPKGSHVVVGIYHAQRDGRHHPEPERFDPDRFEPERLAKMPQGAYLPFGGGTRTCIGKRFALLEATLMLATIAQRCRFELAQAAHPAPESKVTLAPRGGLRMRMRTRAPTP